MTKNRLLSEQLPSHVELRKGLALMGEPPYHTFSDDDREDLVMNMTRKVTPDLLSDKSL